MMDYGRQTPTYRNCAPYADTHGGKCMAVLEAADMGLMEWQENLLNDWLAIGEGGKWANRTCGVSCSRQNGKTAAIVARVAFGMVAYGEWAIVTSHLQKTSTETFFELKALFEHPALSGYVKAIHGAIGREEVELQNGARCKFLARTKSGGRGQHADLWIADEAQALDDMQQGSFLPMLSASRNPQIIYAGTPPDESASGEVFLRLRKDAKGGKAVCWSEWSTDEVGDTSDVARWYQCNPSLGYLIDVSNVEAEHAQMAPDCFARERLGWFADRTKADCVIQARIWDACMVDARPEKGVDSYGVKFSADGSRVALSVCRKDGGAHFVELLFNESTASGTAWLVDWLSERRDKIACVAIDGQAGAQALNDRLEAEMGRKYLMRPRVGDVIAANTALLMYANEGMLQHKGQAQLRDSATLSARRAIGHDGGWGFRSTDSADAEPIESAALAVWASDKAKRNPSRETGVAF